MPSLKELSKQCATVCEVPTNLSKELLLNSIESRIGHGRILDLDEVIGIESNTNLTRYVVLLQSVKDASHLCDEVKREEILTGEQSITIKYQEALPCDLPKEWETKTIQSLDRRQPQASDGARLIEEAPPSVPKRPAKPAPSIQYNSPVGKYGAASGFYHNLQPTETGPSFQHNSPVGQFGAAYGFYHNLQGGENFNHGQALVSGPEQSQQMVPNANTRQGNEGHHEGGQSHMQFYQQPQQKVPFPPGLQAHNLSQPHQNMPHGPNMAEGKNTQEDGTQHGNQNKTQNIQGSQPTQNIQGGQNSHFGQYMHQNIHEDPMVSQNKRGDPIMAQYMQGGQNMHEDRNIHDNPNMAQHIQGARNLPQNMYGSPNMSKGQNDPIGQNLYGGQGHHMPFNQGMFLDPKTMQMVGYTHEFYSPPPPPQQQRRHNPHEQQQQQQQQHLPSQMCPNRQPPAGLQPHYNHDYMRDQSTGQHNRMETNASKQDMTAEDEEESEPGEKPTKILVSNLPSTAHEEYLEMFFEKTDKYGGGTVINVEYDEEDRCAVIEFEQPEAVDVVLEKVPIKMMGQKVEVEVYDPAPIKVCTVVVRGPPNLVSEDQKDSLEMYFEHKKSLGGEIADITFEDDVAYVTFMSEEVAKKVADKEQHLLNKTVIDVQLYIPEPKKKSQIQTSGATQRPDALNRKKGENEREEPVLTVKVKGIKSISSRDTVEFYFDNKRKCGGDELEEIKSDDEDDDVVYVKYKTEEDAKAVAARTHTLEGVELSVSLYSPPKPPPFYPDKILIKGIKATTTEEGLFNLIEAKAKCVPVQGSMVFHAEQEGIAMITLEHEPDFELLEKMCENYKLDGSKLKITPVPVSNCIMVSDIAPGVTKDTLTFYFENVRKSNGGPVKNVVMNDDDTCFIYFEDYEVVDQVLCKEGGHKLGRQKLILNRYQECLGRPEGEIVERKLKIPEPIHLKDVIMQKMKFLGNSRVNHDTLEGQLRNCHTRYVWSEGQVDVILECTLTKEVKDSYKLVKTWEKEAKKCFDDFLKTISVHQLPVLQDVWQKVMEQLKEVSIDNPDNVTVFVEKKEGCIIAVGNKPAADSLKDKIDTIIKTVCTEAEKEKQKVTEVINTLKPIQTRMLLASKFPKEMTKSFPELEVKINVKKNEIVFEGSVGNVRDAKLKMFEMKENFATSTTENLSKLSIGLFQEKQTKMYIIDKLEKCSIIGVWEIQGERLIILSSTEETIGHCVEIIRDSVVETSIALTKGSSPVINSDSWKDQLGKWHSQYEGKSTVDVDSSLTKIQICSTDDISDEFLSSIKKFLRSNTVLEKRLKCTSNVGKLLEKHYKHETSNICKDLQNYHVSITFEASGGIKISGTEDGIIRAEQKMKETLQKVHRKYHTIVKPGLVDHVKSQRGNENITSIQNIMPVIIGVKGDDDVEDINGDDDMDHIYETIFVRKMKKRIQIKASCKTDDNRNIYTSTTNMTEMSVDVLVNAADKSLRLLGGLGKAMLQKGGGEIEQACKEYIKKEGELRDGEVFVSTAGQLGAKYIAHVIGPIWKGGGNKEKKMLKKAVLNCMAHASTKKAKSIAIPAISCGSSGYPVKKATQAIVRAVNYFFENVQDTSITEVYLCDVKDNTVSHFTQALRDEIGNVKTESESESDDNNDTYASPSTGASANTRRKPPFMADQQSGTPSTSNNQVNIGNMTVKLVKAEIAKEQVDVIVNTTAPSLDLRKGAVSASLVKEGGQKLQDELKTSYPNGIKVDEVAVSGGHKLKCKHVFHTTLSNYDKDKVSTCTDALQNLMNTCLGLAEKQNVASIAFPAIGTGNLGYPKDIVAKEMLKAVSKYSSVNPGSCVKDVRFVIYHRDSVTIQAFEAELGRWSNGERESDRKNRKVDPTYERLQRRKTEATDESDYDFLTDCSSDQPFQNFKVVVEQGDISTEDTDCIVNSSNEALDLNRGAVSKSLLRKGGQALAKEIDRKREKMKKKQLVWTSAPGLQCIKIVHVVAQDSIKGWKTIIERCLQDAENKKYSSIAFPALGTSFKLDPKEIADVMACVFGEFDRTKPVHIKEIRVVVFQKEMVSDFMRIYQIPKKSTGYIQAIYEGVKNRLSDRWYGDGGKSDAKTYQIGKPQKLVNRDSVTFVLVSLNNNVIDQAIVRLEKSLENEVQNKSFKDSIIRKLDANQVAEIKAIGMEQNVQLNVDVKSGQIHVSGLSKNLMEAGDKIHGIMRDAIYFEKQKETAMVLSNIVQWFYIEDTDIDQKLQAYDATISYNIEKAFKDQEKTYSFINSADGKKYIVDFKKMQEYAEDDPKDVVNVIRRDHLKEGTSATPTSWGDYKGNLKVVILQATDQEYKDIEQKFQATAGVQRNVQKIERIQNKTLWNQYHAKKKQLDDQNPPNTTNEHSLWHGTAEEAVDNINTHGFNRSYCGKNATALGNGVYFAVNASYSCQDTYSRPSNGSKRIYYCRVLTGEYVRGKAGIRVPPPKPSGGSNAIYDSVVDNESNPGMYIIFNDTQAYPEYLITFSQ